jgi:arginine/serine-rich splicing factor 7
MSRQIYVGRLGTKVKREDLQQEFEKHGKIKDIDLRNSHAFIEFEGSDEAREAIQ